MSVNALSGHGSLIKRNTVTIAELGDITLPGLTRNEFEALTQDENIDSFILGVLRREPVTAVLNWIPSNGTHDHITGLMKAAATEPPAYDRWDFTTPGGLSMTCSGQVKDFHNLKAPVDGKMSAEVVIRMSGKMWVNGVLFG